RFHGVDGSGELDAGCGEHFGEFDGAGADGVHTVKDEAAGGGVNQVNDVIHGAAEFVHVLAIERSDKGLVELAEDLVGELVALMLNGLDDLDLLGDAGVMLQHLGEGLSAGDDVFSLLLKENEKIAIARHEPLQKSWHVTRSPLRSGNVAERVYSRGRNEARNGVTRQRSPGRRVQGVLHVGWASTTFVKASACFPHEM